MNTNTICLYSCCLLCHAICDAHTHTTPKMPILIDFQLINWKIYKLLIIAFEMNSPTYVCTYVHVRTSHSQIIALGLK